MLTLYVNSSRHIETICYTVLLFLPRLRALSILYANQATVPIPDR